MSHADESRLDHRLRASGHGLSFTSLRVVDRQSVEVSSSTMVVGGAHMTAGIGSLRAAVALRRRMSTVT